METIAGYTILEKIDETQQSIVFRAQKDPRSKTEIIKVLKGAWPSPTDIARFKHEYELLMNIDLDGVVSTSDIKESNSGIAIILEDFGAISLKKILNKKKLTIHSFLDIAVAIAHILGSLHKLNIIHNDIKPANILINEEKNIVKLADFGITKILTRENDQIYNPAVIEGSLLYMSPEQTGRTNRSVDYRSDLYSLGITFYEMLTGSVPFKSTDPMEVIHSHIAREPAAPHIKTPGIPKIISAIVLKLLSKSADNRYQNSLCLMSDLQECRSELEKNGSIDSLDKTFRLAENDIPIKLDLSQKLVSRDKELAILFESFHRKNDQKKEMVLVSGPPGIGKSYLVHEAHDAVLSSSGYFISGKYNQFGEEVPYSAIRQAFRELARLVLTESKERIESWKQQLLSTLAPNGKIITDIIPEIEFIIGKQPAVPELPPGESENRFNFVFKKFVALFASEKHPLFLFLDDLQWADAAGLKLIKNMAVDRELGYLFLIGSYRDNEVSGSHPLLLVLDEMKKSDVIITNLSLRPLAKKDMNLLISHILRCDENELHSLSDLVYQKTNGNPFFVNQFLKNLYEINALELHPALGWKWDTQKIKDLLVTDNVAALMSKKISTLPEETQDILNLCACLGNSFDLETLTLVYGKPVEETLQALQSAINENFFITHDNSYKFSHDRIQEAAYALLSGSKLAKQHYRIGSILLEHADEAELQSNMLYIINQLNYWIHAGLQGNNKENLPELNLKAGIQAKKSAAYDTAFNYLERGIRFLENDCWKHSYDLSLSLHLEAAESAYLFADFQRMKQLAEEILVNAKTLLDKIKIYEIQIQGHIARNQMLEAINMALPVLRQLGVSLPPMPNKAHIIFGLLKTRFLLRGMSVNKTGEYKQMKDPAKQAAERILQNISSSVYSTRPNLLPLIIFKQISLFSRYGYTRQSGLAFLGYGVILIGGTNDIIGGYNAAKLGESIINKYQTIEIRARSIMVFNTLIRHWKEPLRETLNPLLEGYQYGLDAGDFEYASRSLFTFFYHSYVAGVELTGLGQKMDQHNNAIGSLQQKPVLSVFKQYRQVIENLTGTTGDPCCLTGNHYNEKKMLDFFLSMNDENALCTFYNNKMILYFLFRDYFSALEYAAKTEKLLNVIIGTVVVPAFYFFDSLCRLALFSEKTKPERKKKKKKVSKNQRKLKKWARHSPMNHLHKYYLVEAELARTEKNPFMAMEFYEKAIIGARENNYIQEEALACELAAGFYLENNFSDTGVLYLKNAYDCYSRWGARAKAKDLEFEYSQYNFSEKRKPQWSYEQNNTDSFVYDTLTTSTKASELLDLSTIISASQALSGEIDLGSLLEQMMKFAIENAGAQKGFLLLLDPKKQQLYIEAAATNSGLRVLQSIPLNEHEELSHAIINFVFRTGEDLILHNAHKQGLFAADPYITRNKSKSVLCMPIKDRGSMNGILYLENNLAENIFTPERIQLLSILSSQCAISINNARNIIQEKQNAVLEKEIMMARDIQLGLLPKNIPDIPGALVSFKYEPMMGVGGDFMDIRYDKEKNRLGLFICDVSGHGVSAALTASMISMALDSNWDTFMEKPVLLLREMRKNLIGKMGKNFFSAATCCLDLENGSLIVTSAGHPPFIIIRKNGSAEIIKTKGRLINDFFEPNSTETEATLYPGDRIILYTDGIIEAQNREGEFLGITDDKKFCSWIAEISAASSSPGLLCRNVYTGVIEYTGEKTLEDDFTILAAEYRGKSS
ncbi:MAG: AAA family ATPase [bacterium]|nr:AAA family ATPase [bacterium]